MVKAPGFSCAEQSRNFECRCVSYDPLMLNALILVLFFFLGWKILEINGQCKSLNRCYSQLEKNIADSFKCDRRYRCIKGFSNGSVGDSKRSVTENLDGTGDSDNERERTSENESSICKNSIISCSCEDFPSGRCRNDSTGVRMQHLIDDKQDELDLNKKIYHDMRIAETEVYQNHEDGQELDSVALKRAIKIEQGYRAAAYLELEKERKAAASAAHEAMVLILRLQNAKHLIELQAKQHQREAKQRQLYDQEVIKSLREIISKQEIEKEDMEGELMKMCRKRSSDSSFDEVDEGNHNMSTPCSPIAENNISEVSGFLQDAEANYIS